MASKNPICLGDPHLCPKTTNGVPHAMGVVISGTSNVTFFGKPVAREGDQVQCSDGSIAIILPGRSCVCIHGKHVALDGDLTSHGGILKSTCNDVFIEEGDVFVNINNTFSIRKPTYFTRGSFDLVENKTPITAKTKNEDDPIVDFEHPARDQKNVTDYSMMILKKIMRMSHVQHAVITRVNSTAAEQAQVMFNNLVNHQSSSYKPPGQKVIAIYYEALRQGSNPQREPDRSMIIERMRKRILELAKDNVHVSMHVEQNIHQLNVFDVGPHSIPQEKHAAFIRTAVQAHASKLLWNFLYPGNGDPTAYHFEILQPGAHI